MASWRDMVGALRWALAGALVLVPSVAHADVAPGPVGYGIVVGLALALALPGGLLFGSLLYVMIARGATEAAKAKEPNLSIFERPLWRRCFVAVTLVLLVGTAWYLDGVFKADRDAQRERQGDRYEHGQEEPTVNPKSTTTLPN